MASLISDITGVLFPELCLGCNSRLYRNEKLLCFNCRTSLPQTHFHRDPENPVFKIFWGRVPIEFAAAFLYFSPKGTIQHMIHHLKYRKCADIGVLLGKAYGEVLKKDNCFTDADCIVPVPLHPSKKKKRGYNQSEVIADGLSEAMGIPVDTDGFGRSKHTETQTKKGRYKRWENVDSIFKVSTPDAFAGKHVLLIDDVITTGATIEACAHEILSCEGAKVSVASLACAMRI